MLQQPLEELLEAELEELLLDELELDELLLEPGDDEELLEELGELLELEDELLLDELDEDEDGFGGGL